MKYDFYSEMIKYYLQRRNNIWFLDLCPYSLFIFGIAPEFVGRNSRAAIFMGFRMRFTFNEQSHIWISQLVEPNSFEHRANLSSTSSNWRRNLFAIFTSTTFRNFDSNETHTHAHTFQTRSHSVLDSVTKEFQVCASFSFATLWSIFFRFKTLWSLSGNAQ